MRQDVATESVDRAQRPTPTTLRMRIAETQIKQHRVAAKLDISDAQLSKWLNGHKPADADLLARIAAAIEEVVEAVA